MSKLTYFYPVGYGVGAAIPTQGNTSFSASADGNLTFSTSPAARFSVAPSGGGASSATAPAPSGGGGSIQITNVPPSGFRPMIPTPPPPSVVAPPPAPRPAPPSELVPGGGPWPWLPGPTPPQPPAQMEPPTFRMSPPPPSLDFTPVMKEVLKPVVEYCIPVRTSYGALRCSPSDSSDP